MTALAIVEAFSSLPDPRRCASTVESGNHYLGALKGNQGGLFDEVKVNFQVEDSYRELSKGHGRIEERVVSACRTIEGIRAWPGLQSLIRVTATRTVLKGEYEIVGRTETRYYIPSLSETAKQFATRIRA